MTDRQRLIIVLGVVILAALFLSGCLSPKELECLARDATSRPCNW